MRASRPDFYPMDPLYQLSESVAVLETATETNQRQIAEIASNTNKAINDLANNTALQFKEISAVLEKHGAQTNTRLEALSGNFQASQKPNYMLWLAALAVFFTLVAAGSKITDLQTQVTMAPISAKADISEKDRAAIHQDLVSNRDLINQTIAAQKVIGAQLVEVETQFRASDQSRNVQFAGQERMNNILMQLTHSGLNYPASPHFFPSVSNGYTPQN